VASQGNTLEFLLSPTRDAQAVKRFFHTTLTASHAVSPRVITVDKHAASPKAFHERKATGVVPTPCEWRQRTYLHNLVEQDHRFIQRLVTPGMSFWSFKTAWSTFQGYEVMHMISKGQVQKVDKGESLRQAGFIARWFGVAVYTQQNGNSFVRASFSTFLATQPLCLRL
jgi:transposase-like protein